MVILYKTVKPKAFGIYLDHHKKYIRGFQFWKLVKHCISEKKEKKPLIIPQLCKEHCIKHFVISVGKTVCWTTII